MYDGYSISKTKVLHLLNSTISSWHGILPVLLSGSRGSIDIAFRVFDGKQSAGYLGATSPTQWTTAAFQIYDSGLADIIWSYEITRSKQRPALQINLQT